MQGITIVLKRLENQFKEIVLEFDEDDSYGEWMFKQAIYNLYDELESEVKMTYNEMMEILGDYCKFRVWTTDEFIKGEPGADYFNPDDFIQTVIEEVYYWCSHWDINPENCWYEEEHEYKRNWKNRNKGA